MSWLWGALGAFVFAVNRLIFQFWATDRTPSGRIKATAEFLAALLTGSIFAEGLTVTAVHYADRIGVKAEGVAVALTIGWASNYLWPKVLRKLGEHVDRADPKEPT